MNESFYLKLDGLDLIFKEIFNLIPICMTHIKISLNIKSKKFLSKFIKT